MPRQGLAAMPGAPSRHLSFFISFTNYFISFSKPPTGLHEPERMPMQGILRPTLRHKFPPLLFSPLISLTNFRAEKALEASGAGVAPPKRHCSTGSHLPMQPTTTRLCRSEINKRTHKKNEDEDDEDDDEDSNSNDNKDEESRWRWQRQRQQQQQQQQPQ